MKNLVIFILALLNGSLYASNRCLGGGDGGGLPFSLIPQAVLSNASYVKTDTMIRDFLLWEKMDQILYLDQQGGTRVHNLWATGDHLFSKSGPTSSLSKVTDPGRRYYTDAQTQVVVDTVTGTHKRLPFSIPMKEIFWHDSILYLMPRSDPETTAEIHHLYSYNAKTEKTDSCSLFQKGYKFHPAEINQYPYVFGYHFETKANGEVAPTILRVDVGDLFLLIGNSCMVHKDHGYQDLFAGPIKKMYRYSKLDKKDPKDPKNEKMLLANLYEIDHPTKRLLWDLGEDECTYYNLQRVEHQVLRSELPVVAFWEGYEGLNLLYPRRMQRRAVEGVGQFGFSKADFALSSDAKQLFVSQRSEPNEDKFKILFQYRLE